MADGRQRLTLGEPPESPSALEDFPDRQLDAGQQLHRVTREELDVWWFSSSPGGRFNLAPPAGTCYLAFDPVAAILESLGPRLGGPVARQFFDERAIHTVALPHAARAADSTARGSLGFGVTPEVSTVVPYGLSQRWAAAWRRAGFDGVVYWSRHDPQRSRCLALFGDEGARDEWAAGTGHVIDDDTIDRLVAECGLEILEIPRLDQMVLA